MIETIVKAQESESGGDARNLTTHCSRPEIARLSSDSMDAWLDTSRSAEFERWVAY